MTSEEMTAPVKAYLEQLKQRRSPSTVANYGLDLRRMMKALAAHDIQTWNQVDQYLLMQVVTELSATVSVASIQRYRSSLRQFYRYLLEQRLVDHDPTQDLALPRRVMAEPATLSVEETLALIETITGTAPLAIRNRTILEVMYATGLKVSELLALTKADLHFNLNFLTVHDHLGKERLVPISQRAQKWVEKYLQVARPQLVNSANETAILFLNVRGGQLSRQAVWQLLKNSAAKAQLQVTVTPEILRASLKAHLLANQADYLAVVQILGNRIQNMPLLPLKRIQKVYRTCLPTALEEGE